MLPASFTPEFLRQLEILRLRSRRAFLGSRQGGHLSLKRGHGLEFSDHRKYEMGDHPRSIDWGVYARSERLYVKRFQEEQDLSVLLIIDSSASMGVPEGEGKWTRACDIALSLAYIALMQQDSVNLAVLGKFISPKLYGAKAIHHIGEMLIKAKPSGQIDLLKQVTLAASRVRFPGVAVFISDFLIPQSEIEAAFNILRAKNLEITAIQVLAPSDEKPFAISRNMLAVDSETGEELSISATADVEARYTELLSQHNKKLKNFFNKAQVSYVKSLASTSLSTTLIDDLTGSGLLR